MFFVIILFIIILILLFINHSKEKTNKNLNKIISEQIQKEQARKLKNQVFLEQKRQEEEAEYKKTKEYKLELVKNNNILIRELIGLQEFMIYRELIFCEDIKNNFIVFPQISLKSFLKNEKESEVWTAYSDLIVDFLFVIKDFKNQTSKPFAVLEFNGGGHYGDKSDLLNVEKIKKNDEIKKQAITKAGILFFILEAKEVYKDNQCFLDGEKLKIKINAFAEILKSNLDQIPS